MRFFDAARKGRQSKKVASITGGAYGGGYGIGNRMYGYGAEGLDYNKEAGARWDNSIVYSLLSLLATTLGGVPIITARLKGESTGQGVTGSDIEAIADHPITQLLERPNPWYGGSLLETTAIFMEASRGNSYAYKHRSGGSKVVHLELLPEGSCFPYTVPGSGDWISYYAIFTASGYSRVKAEDVLHMRWMTANPFWMQIGMSPLEACLPDLVADKLAARHEAMLLKNGAVSSAWMSPKPFKGANGDVLFDLQDDQCEAIQRRIDSGLTGDNKNRSFVFNVPMDLQQIGFDSKQMALTETRHLSESRICAAFNIPPVVANLLVGLEKGNNRASYAAAVDQFFDACAIPYMRHRGRQMTEDLIPELGNEGEVVMYDESKIPALKARLVRDLMERTGGPLESINEGRAELGMPRVEGGDAIRQSSGTPTSPKTTEPDDARKTEDDTTEDTTTEDTDDFTHP